MINAKLMANNIIAGIKANYKKKLSNAEKEELLAACKKVLNEIHGPKTKKYVASEVGKGNGFCHFEDFSLGIEYDVFKEAAECIMYMKDDKKMRLAYRHNSGFAEYYAG